MQSVARFVVGLLLGTATLAIPAAVRQVAASPSQAGGGETLVRSSSWPASRFDWSSHDLQWSVSHRVLTLMPTHYNVGWIEAPFRSTRSESFAIDAVVRFSKRQPPRNWGWVGGLYLIAHFHPPFQTQNGFQTGTGVSGAYIFGETSGVGLFDSAAPHGNPVTFDSSVEWQHGSWTTFRLEVHAGMIQSDGSQQDTYSFTINGVQVSSATLGDWLQYNHIALASRFGLDVKSLRVYRLP